MDEPVTVEARLTPDGQLEPRVFVWRGHRHTVASTGRRWQEAEGRHILVMTPDQHVFELVYLRDEHAWRMRGAAAGPHSRVPRV